MVPSDDDTIRRIANHGITIAIARAAAIFGPPLAAYLFIATFNSLKEDAIAIRHDIRAIERMINSVQIENAMHSEQIKNLIKRVDRIEVIRAP